MAQKKTVNLLPQIFRSDTNQKFLSATLDQLTQEPKLETLYGYVGRQFAPTFKVGDSYVLENDSARQNYQLEPGIQVQNEKDETVFFSSYNDFLNKIKYYGGLTNNHDRLFANEYYSYDPQINLDKFVNFSQYYWLTDGPDSVDVDTTGVKLVDTINVRRDIHQDEYFYKDGGTENSTLVFARGGTYTFNINQPGHKFWIQSELGVDGTLNSIPTKSSRDILGVTNNGAETGEVIFQVPQKTAQERFINMPNVFNVEYASPEAYSDIHNKTLSQVQEAFPEWLGITGQLDGKHLIFVISDALNSRGEEIWTADEVVVGSTTYTGWGAGDVVAEGDRTSVFQVQFKDLGIGDPLLRLVPVQSVNHNEKVFIKYGLQYANTNFYLDTDDLWKQEPLLSAQFDELFIQDADSPTMYTRIKIVDYAGWEIDIDKDVIGQKTYTAPNGVVFTNGLKIQFGTDVKQTAYRNKIYYIEGVGQNDGIQLVDTELLVRPELYLEELETNYPGEIFPEYITINRSSKDLNAWSRHNRWFHKEVIEKTAEYNATEIILDQNLRATRPIIEFEPNLWLTGSGRIGKKAVDILDTTITDVFDQLDGKVIDFAMGVTLVDGMRVIFTADNDPEVHDKIYVLSLVQYDIDDGTGLPSGPKYVKLTKADDGDLTQYDTVTVTGGGNKGTSWYFDGVTWMQSQAKTQQQQEPLFEVCDVNGKSLRAYDRSSFEGTKIFGYVRNSAGVVDKELGFALTYRNFGTQGDIEFGNYFNTDTFTYFENQEIKKQNINTGYLQKIIDGQTLEPKNTWDKVVEESKQYQLLTFEGDGTTKAFTVDVDIAVENSIPYVKVLINNTYLRHDQFDYEGKVVTLDVAPADGSLVDILVYSSQVSANGYYQVPSNLDLNAQNVDVDNLTLGQMRNHLVELSRNSTVVKGNVLSSNNLRDIHITLQGGTILKHSAPVPYAQLFLVDNQANFIDGLRHAQREYAKFKNKFLEFSTSLDDIDPADVPGSVDLIMTELNKLKNNSFPWHYSDMVPYNTLRNTIEYTIFDTLKTDYEITSTFLQEKLSNQAALVYLNGVQLLKDKDYNFLSDRPAVRLNLEHVDVSVDDKLKIIEFSNTDGNYVPETPTKLGLYPKWYPEKFRDDTYRDPIDVIRGHDGSITPAFNDYRDDFLLELEKRIYNNCKLPNPHDSFGEVWKTIPGKFRKTGYTRREFSQLLSKNFLNWAGNNRVNFSTNDTFLSNDPFTWNYSKTIDRIDGEQMPGSWRAVYEYFYDTHRPHLTPWEMLGLSKKPEWWEDYYGPAPYTGGNKLLWDHLEEGRIVQGDLAGIHKEYARPGLSQVIPVDVYGFLKSPAEIITKGYASSTGATAWGVGQMGPTESAWRNSSEYPFAVNQALALATPGKYFGLLANTFRYKVQQPIDYYLTENQQFLKQTDLEYNGHLVNNVRVRASGYLNWIAEYLISQGINPETRINQLTENYNVKLSYQLGGFTDKSYLKILAEQNSPSSSNDSIVIPDENYQVYLNKGAPVDKVKYSAVIVEKTTNGYTVKGYDNSEPYFTIIPSIVNNNAQRVDVLNRSATIFNDYQNVKVTVPYGFEFISTQQVADFLIGYQRYLISQGFVFTQTDDDLGLIKNFKLSVQEFLYWIQQGWKPGSILVLSPVADRLRLATSGSITDRIADSQYGSKIIDQNFKLVKNNNYNVTRDATSFEISLTGEESVIGYAEFDLVQYEHVLVFDNTTVFNDIIYKPELGNRQYRLKLIGKKTGDWDGSLSAPGYVYQDGIVPEWTAGKDYLKGDLVEFKGQYYTALENISAQNEFEFESFKQLENLQIQESLLPNFATMATESKDYYNSYPSIDNKDQVSYSHGLIGFRPRQYLDDLGVTETSQIEFYKGFIKQKGTRNAIEELKGSTFNNLSSDLDYYEEWAIRIGEFGAVDSNPYVEIELDEETFGANPSLAQFVSEENSNDADGISIFNKQQLYKTTDSFKGNISLVRTDESNRVNDILTAGYVNPNDVDKQIFDLNDYRALNDDLAVIGSGYTVWVAKDLTEDWNVYRVTETNNFAVEVSNSLDGYISFKTDLPHGLQENDIFLVKGFNDQFDGVYKAYRIEALDKVMVEFEGNVDNLTTETGNGLLYVLNSLRFQYMEDCRKYMPPNGWKEGEIVWIDEDAATTFEQGQPVEVRSNTWKVYQKNNPWKVQQKLEKTVSEYTSLEGYGETVKLSSDGLLAIVGNPQTDVVSSTLTGPITATKGATITQSSSGATATLLKSVDNGLAITFKYVGSTEFDTSGVLAVNSVVTTSAPSEITKKTGQVTTYLRETDNTFSQGFNIQPDTDTAREFGYSADMAVSSVTKLAVGAPGSDNDKGYVFIYQKNTDATLFDRGQVLTGNISSRSRYGSSLAWDQSGHWLYVGEPDNDRVYVYGLNKFVSEKEETVSVVDDKFITLSGNLTALAGSTISQPTAGGTAELLLDVTANTEIKVSTLTNIIESLTGNIVIGGANVSANLYVNGIDSGVYPTATSSTAVTNVLSLSFVPDVDDANSLLVTDAGKTYIPGVDYILNGSDLEFTANIAEGDVRIEQGPYFAEVAVVTGNTGSEFGYSVDSSYDGAQLAVGAPNDTVGVIKNATEIENGKTYTIVTNDDTDYTTIGAANSNVGTTFTASISSGTFEGNGTVRIDFAGSGTVWVYDRVIEAFKSTGELTYTTINDINDVHRVTVDGIEVTNYTTPTSTSVQFVDPVEKNKVIMVEVNEFQLLEKLIGIDSLEGGLDAIQANARFGTDLTICSNNCAIYVGAPQYTADSLYSQGAVWKFHNKGRLYGTNTGTVQNPTFTPGDTIRIDNYEVTLTGTTLTSLVNDINNAKILGVTAHNENGYLRIDTDSTVAKNLLRILSGEGTVLEDAGLSVFAFMQIIVNPYRRSGEFFGAKVKLAPNAYMLVIGSEKGTTQDIMEFDEGITQFDLDATRWVDAIPKSGSVYTYELYDDPRDEVENPGRYQYAQQLIPTGLEYGDQFGAAIDIDGDYILVGAPSDDETIEDGGVVYLFTNPNRTRGWNLLRYQDDRVDIESLNKLYLYDKQTNTILVNLQYIDPVKGKVLGEAEQEINYKTAYDPAYYNRGVAEDVNPGRYWSNQHVGQVWWDLDKVRYTEYEQDSLTYRSANWGRVFEGSRIVVAEWIESDVLPSQYVANDGDGEPVYQDDSHYTEISIVDPVTNIIVSKYYYWVINKESVDPLLKTRKLPVANIAEIISNPKTQGIPYAAVVKNNAIILYNIGSYLSSNNTVLHIGYDTKINTNIIHSEYELVQKNNPDDLIPPKIVNKFIDSLSGFDKDGRVVPDPKLSTADKYGVGFRPRQSMFQNRLEAVKQLVNYVNSILIKHPIARQYDLTRLFTQEAQPNFKLGEYDEKITTDENLNYIDVSPLAVGYRVLIENDTRQDNLWTLYELDSNKKWNLVRVQSYKTQNYWTYEDWYATGFSADEQIEYSVDTLPDALKLPVAPGDEVLVKVATTDVGSGWNLLTVLDDGTFRVVGIQNGTIQLSESLAKFDENQVGFGNQGYEEDRYDENPNLELRYILESLEKDIFINTLNGEFNKLFFVMLNYLFTEQKYVDWVFKSSFISVVHNLRKLEQYPNFIEDNQSYYQDYINEVKPYRTKLREYLLKYNGEDTFGGDITDFDLPPYYDTDLKQFRSPDGTQTDDGNKLANRSEYSQWYANRNSQVEEIEIINGGKDYTTAPKVTIINSGSGGSGAEAVAEIDGDTGAVVKIIVTKAGSGYQRTPTVVINGNGTGAKAYVRIRNPYVRSFDQTMKFDRISYTTSVKEWKPNTQYQVGDIVANPMIDGNKTVWKSYIIKANITSASTFVEGDYTRYEASQFTNANDRIIGYYSPGINQIDRKLEQLIPGIEYPGVTLTGNDFNRFPGFSGTASVEMTLSSPVTVVTGDYVTQGSANITVNANASSSYTITGTLNNNNDFVEGSGNVLINGSYVSSYPTDVEYISGQSGTEYDTGLFDAVDYDDDGLPILSEKEVDTILRSNYTDTTLGTLPEDINVDGGAYYDVYSSHAPEELIPGIVFDTLDMKVFTQISGNSEVIGYRIFDNMIGDIDFTRIADSGSTDLAQDLGLSDDTIYVNDASVLTNPNPSLEIPGVIFIGTERITYYTRDTSANTLGQIRRGTNGTAIQTHLTGRSVVDASIVHDVPETDVTSSELSANVTYTSAGTVTYRLNLSGNITANVGDFITQATTSANATVIGSDIANSDSVLINYNSSQAFTANTSVSANVAVNGTYTTNVFVESTALEGTVDADGEVTLLEGTKIKTANSWYNLGTTTATDGTGLSGSTTKQALFLKEESARFIAFEYSPERLGTEDSINTLITEDGNEITGG